MSIHALVGEASDSRKTCFCPWTNLARVCWDDAASSMLQFSSATAMRSLPILDFGVAMGGEGPKGFWARPRGSVWANDVGETSCSSLCGGGGWVVALLVRLALRFR